MGCAGSSTAAVAFEATAVKWDEKAHLSSIDSAYTWVHMPGEKSESWSECALLSQLSWEGEWRQGVDKAKGMGASSMVGTCRKVSDKKYKVEESGTGANPGAWSWEITPMSEAESKATGASKCATLTHTSSGEASGRSTYKLVKMDDDGDVAFHVYQGDATGAIALKLTGTMMGDVWNLTAQPGGQLIAKYNNPLFGEDADPRTMEVGAAADLQLVLALYSAVQAWKVLNPKSMMDDIINIATEMVTEVATTGGL